MHERKALLEMSDELGWIVNGNVIDKHHVMNQGLCGDGHAEE